MLSPCPTGSSCQSPLTQGLKVNDLVCVSLADDVSVFMLLKGLLSGDVIVCGCMPPVMLLLEEEVLTVPGCTQFLHHLGEEL